MWVLPLTEYEVRGRMQVVFLWRASNDFGSQLSTLTGPESYGGLGTLSSTSPHAICSHMDKFSLQMENSPGRFKLTAKLRTPSVCVCGKTWHHIDQSTLGASPLFLPSHKVDPSPHCAVTVAVMQVLPSCSVNWPDAFSNPPTSSWAPGGLGPLPT